MITSRKATDCSCSGCGRKGVGWDVREIELMGSVLIRLCASCRREIGNIGMRGPMQKRTGKALCQMYLETGRELISKLTELCGIAEASGNQTILLEYTGGTELIPNTRIEAITNIMKVGHGNGAAE